MGQQEEIKLVLARCSPEISLVGYGDTVRTALVMTNRLHTTAQKIWVGASRGGVFFVRKTTGDPLVADTATLSIGPFASIPPFVIVKLGQSL